MKKNLDKNNLMYVHKTHISQKVQIGIIRSSEKLQIEN